LEEAVAALLNALNEYLKVQGPRIISVLEITGQDRIRIEVRALYRYFEPTENFEKVSDVLREIIDKKLHGGLEKYGINLVAENDTLSLEVSKNYVKKLLNNLSSF